MKRMLIDTNIYSYALMGDESVIELLREADEIGFSVVSIGELLVGFRLGGKEQILIFSGFPGCIWFECMPTRKLIIIFCPLTHCLLPSPHPRHSHAPPASPHWLFISLINEGLTLELLFLCLHEVIKIHIAKNLF